MRPIETVHAEPRDSVDSPAYRVNFWQRSSPEQAWNLNAYALTEVEDITEVLRWVDEHAAGRRFEVFVEMDEEPARFVPESAKGWAHPVAWKPPQCWRNRCRWCDSHIFNV